MATIKQVLAAISQDGTLGPNQKKFVVEAIQRAETWCKLKEPHKPRKITNAKNLMTLEEWEYSNAHLSSPRVNLEGWAKGNNLNTIMVFAMIEEFRCEMKSKGKQYANFRAAFQNWFTRGYLSKTLEQCRLQSVTVIQTKGINL